MDWEYKGIVDTIYNNTNDNFCITFKNDYFDTPYRTLIADINGNGFVIEKTDYYVIKEH